MKHLACLILLVFANTALAGDKVVEYEIARRNQDYDKAITEAVRQGLPIVVWVGLEDPYEEYQQVSKPAIHVFLNKFQGMDRGVIVGLPSPAGYRRLDLTKDYAKGINALLTEKKNVSK